MTTPKILISYARADGLDASARLRAELQLADCQVWRDIEEMRGGKDWKIQIREAIKVVDVMVVVLSPAAVQSEHVQWEIDTAETLSTPVISLLIVPFQVPPAFTDPHYHDLSSDTVYTRGFAALIRDLNSLKGVETQMTAEETPSTSQFDLRGAVVTESLLGNYGTYINKPKGDGSQELLLADAVRQVNDLLKSEHQQLRNTLIFELQSMSAQHLAQVDMIVNHYRSGTIPASQLTDFMRDTRELLVALHDQTKSGSAKLATISQQVEQVLDTNFSQQHQFELTVPIIPFILEYHASFGASMDLNLRNLVDRVKRVWDEWAG
jgi:hypothetical protein